MCAHTCYELTWCNTERQLRSYFGITGIKEGQNAEKAADHRLRRTVKKPPDCIVGSVKSSFRIHALGRPMTEQNCLLEEVILTARALADDLQARGACYACARLHQSLRASAGKVRRIVHGLSGGEARSALLTYIKTLHSSHPLAVHLEKRAYAESRRTRQQPMLKQPVHDCYRKRKSGKSGTSGHIVRDGQLDRREYERGSDKHRILKRGRGTCTES